MPKLKVFQAHLGFFDTVVAAPSQKAALQAWGSRQDLFRDGTAAIASDPQAIEAALAKPGVVLKRLSGSKEGFLERPLLPKSSRPNRKRPAAPRRAEASHRKQDRNKLQAAEQALAKLKEERERVRKEFANREVALQNEKRAREDEFGKQITELEKQTAAEKKRLSRR